MMRSDRHLLCLVTDRGRMEGGGTSIARLVGLARQAVAAGVDMIQVRERDLETRALVDLVATLVDAARGSSTTIVVNDRLDVALASGAGGVHLRADSVPPARVRAVVPSGFLVGRSVHSVDEAVAHGASADYLIAGTVFRTSSKPGSALLGVAGLARIVAATTAPVIAIGGVTPQNLSEIAATGAAGVAGIGLFLTTPMKELVAEFRSAFDIAKAAS